MTSIETLQVRAGGLTDSQSATRQMSDEKPLQKHYWM